MLTTLEAVVQRLIEGYNPDRIILFGSHAAGEAEEGARMRRAFWRVRTVLEESA